MKKILFALFLFASFAASAQSVDSTKILQTITLAQRYHVYILSNLSDWGSPETINYINQVRSDYDTANMNKPITVTAPSAFIRDAYRQLSYQAEGQATVYNAAINQALGSQITNPWLGAAVYEINYQNAQARDAKINQTAARLLQINLVQ